MDQRTIFEIPLRFRIIIMQDIIYSQTQRKEWKLRLLALNFKYYKLKFF